MAMKVIELTGVGPVTLIKRTQSRSLRLSVTSRGVRVSMPRWTSYDAGETFARNNIAWIQTELSRHTQPLLVSGQRIGKLHTLRFEFAANGQSIASRVTGTEIIVRLQHGEVTADPTVQERANKAVLRALKREATTLLPPRLASLAAKHGKSFTATNIKQLKRRWGSCDQARAITLNLFLMELPWEFIDYVLLHELAHTVEMNHGPAFWRTLTAMEPRARALAKELRSHQPVIGAWQ